MSLILYATSWSVNDVQKPMVGAVIGKGYNLGDKYFVPLYCAMLLICHSQFQVAGFKNGETLENIKMTYVDGFSIRNFYQDARQPMIKGTKNDTIKHAIKKGEGLTQFECHVENGTIPVSEIKWIQYSRSDEDFTKNGAVLGGNKTLDVVSLDQFRCRAGNIETETEQLFQVYSAIGFNWIRLFATSAVVFSISVLRLQLWLRHKKKTILFKQLYDRVVAIPENMALHNDKPLNDQAGCIAYNPKFEVPKESFVLIHFEPLGTGEFGRVFEGVKRDQSGNGRSVAVKVPRNSNDPQHSLALFSEMLIMARLRPHVNVLSLIGYCTKNIKTGKLFVLTELCSLRSLRDFIPKRYGHLSRSNEGELPILEELLLYAYQGANGMEHLATHTPPILHRDLALRNLLLTSDKVVKVSDFGLARQDENYYSDKSTYKTYPVFWMALESLRERKFTQESDVWSFGVVLWELFSLAKIPYVIYQLQGVRALQNWLGEGNRLEKPEHTPEDIYQLMLDCWKERPKERPSFSECKRRIASSTKMSPGGYSKLISHLNSCWTSFTNQGIDSSSLPSTSSRDASSISPMLKEIGKAVTKGEPNTSKTPNVCIELVAQNNQSIQECNDQNPPSPYEDPNAP